MRQVSIGVGRYATKTVSTLDVVVPQNGADRAYPAQRRDLPAPSADPASDSTPGDIW
jgi:hypothetical protein